MTFKKKKKKKRRRRKGRIGRKRRNGKDFSVM